MDIDGRRFELEPLYILRLGNGTKAGATVTCRSSETATAQIRRWLASGVNGVITIETVTAVVEQP